MGSGNAPLRAMIANTVSVRRRAGKKADIHAFRSIGQQGLKADLWFRSHETALPDRGVAA